MLEKIERIELEDTEDREIGFHFQPPASGHTVMRMNQVSKAMMAFA